MENDIVTTDELKNLKEIFEMPIETDEDYQKLGEITDEEE